MTLNRKLTKIVCTIGPSSNDEETIKQMIEAGMNVARLNFSHGTMSEHEKTFELIRNINSNLPIAIDIPGPKIRIGELPEKIYLRKGKKITLTTRNVAGTAEILPVNYSKLPQEVQEGSFIYINDGLVRLKVLQIEGTEIHCIVTDDGEVSSHKGVNVPNSKISLRVPTEADIKAIEKACDLEADFLFVSFVRDKTDLEKIIEIASAKTNNIPAIISKIEHKDALANIEGILEKSEGLMVARGDLAIEAGPAKVPVIQRKLIKDCVKNAKPIIVATQMLESMTKEMIPTRAEASDVAHAVLDGADALMLSAETATGNFPVEAVKMMREIIVNIEQETKSAYNFSLKKAQTSYDMGNKHISTVIASAAVMIAEQINASAIVALTKTGYSARAVSKVRSPYPIFALTPELKTLRRLQLLWGAEPLLFDEQAEIEQLVYHSIEILYIEEKVQPEDTVVLVMGSVLGIPGKINTIQILNVGEVLAGKH